MGATEISSAIREWRLAVGAEHVLTSDEDLAPYLANVSGIVRQTPAVIRPFSTREVQAVVEIANRYRTPLYPFSTGRNLGLGSRLAVQDGATLVDLRRMNRILEVNADLAYAVVEAGVTQSQLADYLRAKSIPLMVNVTGAGRDCSLIGNALERGIGYFSTRTDSLSALEVVTGSGRVVRTGFGHLEGCQIAHVYRHGIGPDISGLFYQSNFGIVTSAGVSLLRMREHSECAVVTIHDESQLSVLIDALRRLRGMDLIQTVVHIGNRSRTLLMVGAGVAEGLVASGVGGEGEALKRAVQEVIEREGFGVWSAAWGIHGTRGQVAEARRQTKSALKGIGRLVFLSDTTFRIAKPMLRALRFLDWSRRKRLILPGVEAVYGLAKGIPTDEALKSLNWALGVVRRTPDQDPDVEGWGMLYCLPFVPLRGDCGVQLVDVAERIFKRHGFEAYITLNIVDDRALEGVINLAFNAHDARETEAAQRAIGELREAIRSHGWMPYRVGIQEMANVVDEKDVFWQVVRDLKSIMDPNHIMAPGRYCLP